VPEALERISIYAEGKGMKKAELDRLQEAGWEVTTVQDLLGLSDAENKIVEMKVALSLKLKKQRLKRHISQKALAKLIGSSQPRVAQIEAGGPNVSMDLLLKALLVSGVSQKEVAKVIAATAGSR
jgi:DNA-binding XRE family transcriptional regulator